MFEEAPVEDGLEGEEGVGAEPGAGAVVGAGAEAVVGEVRAEWGGGEEREVAAAEEVGVEAGGEREDVDPPAGAVDGGRFTTWFEIDG